jgi:membrane-associated protein
VVKVLDSHGLLATFDVAGVFGMLFAETGLFVGFFLPGKTFGLIGRFRSATAGPDGRSTGN